LEILRRTRLVKVGGVCGIDLGKPQDQEGRQPRQRGVARGQRLLVVADRRIQGGLGQEAAGLVVALGRQVVTLVGVELLLGLDFVIGVVMNDPGQDLDGLLGHLLILLRRDLVVGHAQTAPPARQDLGLPHRPGQRIVGLARVAARTAAIAHPGLDRHQGGQGPGLQG
jgi:hypothetical protein